MREALLDPRVNAVAALVIVIGGALWTILSITLTSEPANILAMSGVAIIGFGVQVYQGSLQMRKIEQEATRDPAA